MAALRTSRCSNPCVHRERAPFSATVASQPSTVSLRRCGVQHVDRERTVQLRATRSTETDTPIEKLDRDYCDDFVCTSSPSVELSVRAFAKDLERLRFTPSLFSKDTSYSDPFRTFKGNTKYARQTWILDNVQKPKTRIVKMQMLDKSTAQLDWQLTGQVGMGPVTISFTSVIEMNLLTGRILSHKETWDLSKLPPPLSFMVNANRAAWSAKQASLDAREGLNQVADNLSASMSMDEDSPDIYRDPTDPTKFFQQNQNDNYNDMLTFTMIMIAMYAIYQGFSSVIKL